MDIYESVLRAGPGSDIHGVLEKIAYRIHLKSNRASTKANWNEAKTAFIHWANYRPLGEDRTIEFDLKEVLNFSAYSYRNSGGSPFDHWICAQNDLAQDILKDYFRELERLDWRNENRSSRRTFA